MIAVDRAGAALPPESPRRLLGARTVVALFVTLVTAILGSVRGWQLCASCWLVFGWLVLACVVAASLALVVTALVGADWPMLRAEGRQVLVVAALMLAMLPLRDLVDWLEVVASGPALRARADASMRGGGPCIAMTSHSSDGLSARGGLVYDPAGVIAPRFREAAGWRDDPVVATLSGDCIVEHHLGGPWYRWSEDCDAL